MYNHNCAFFFLCETFGDPTASDRGGRRRVSTFRPLSLSVRSACGRLFFFEVLCSIVFASFFRGIAVSFCYVLYRL